MWHLSAFLQLLATSSQLQKHQRHTDAVQGDLSAGLSPVCCKRTGVAHQLARTEVRGLKLRGPLNSLPQTSMGNRTETWLWGPQLVLEPVWASLSSSFVSQRAQTWSRGTANGRAFFLLFCCNPTTWKTTRWWERGGQPRFQGAWGLGAILSVSLTACQCSCPVLLAVVFFFIWPFNQYLQTFILLHACLLSSLLAGCQELRWQDWPRMIA